MHKLAVLSGGSKGTVFVLAEDSHTVGRAAENMIVLDDGNVSRHHAVLNLNGTDYKVRDLNSANGTFVNSERVTEVLLKNGDRLRMGVTELLYESVAGKGDRPLTPSPVRFQPEPARPAVTLSPAAAPAPAPPMAGPRPVLAPAVVALEKPRKRPNLWLVAVLTAAACWVVGGLLLWWLGIIPPRPVAPAGSKPAAPAAAAATIAKTAAPAPAASSPRVAATAEPARNNEATGPRDYADPKGRFGCTVPAGWQIEEDPSAPQTKVRFFLGADEVRVIVQPAEQGALTEADRDAALKEFGDVMERAQTAGATSQLLGVTWRQIHGGPALQTEFLTTAPSYLWMRQVKFINNGLDHTVGVYVGSADHREQVAPVYERLLESYRSPAPKSPSS